MIMCSVHQMSVVNNRNEVESEVQYTILGRKKGNTDEWSINIRRRMLAHLRDTAVCHSHDLSHLTHTDSIACYSSYCHCFSAWYASYSLV